MHDRIKEEGLFEMAGGDRMERSAEHALDSCV